MEDNEDFDKVVKRLRLDENQAAATVLKRENDAKDEEEEEEKTVDLEVEIIDPLVESTDRAAAQALVRIEGVVSPSCLAHGLRPPTDFSAP